ncbi:ribosome biogenesis GTPase YlqF [Thermostichus vulcanus]|uniref:Ribosome biogenesis GTPase A n=1 Tax=Thermostichus vulcanus str. 'Rupite' TaxID=2813851 RepID=A0ABT0C8N6_THEVL|nr:ribosome biogenesis GTPase YlqF [Thermostichus vulcanus]MCJ2542082.1 ribosome biogenesis GTPase YlqF [Thermostichus vulcanus str. 'Rupite']
MSSPAIQWYPGHIAKAISQLREQLQRVDVVIEVLDARIPLASRHPELGQWLGEKPRVLALNRVDCVDPSALKAWQDWFTGQGIPVYPTNGQSGEGVNRLKQAILQLGQSVNARRQQRGMRPRAIRAVVVGFPNVGKSALLNRLLGRRVAESAARPGVTRQLRWVRLGGDLDLLDSPGIIPPLLPDQEAATKLAICDDIGEAAYTPELVAAHFLDHVRMVHPQAEAILQKRYGWSAGIPTGEVAVHELAERHYQGDLERAARQILNDYRKGLLGPLALELPSTPQATAGPQE